MSDTHAPSSSARSSIIDHRSSILQAEGLQKSYPMGGRNLDVLRGVDVAIAGGEWVAILGASGSGKSTLLHLLGGLDTPSSGSVTFKGEPLTRTDLNAYRRRHVGFVFQQYHLLPELTALENVLIAAMIGRRPDAATRQRARQLLMDLGLSDRTSHRPAKLSGGERQRVAIARALINQPSVLLADEPTGNLDAETGGQILEVFKQLHRAGQSIVMVTHDPRIAAAADRVLRLERGRIGSM